MAEPVDQPTPEELEFAHQAVKEIWELTGWTLWDEWRIQTDRIYHYQLLDVTDEP